MSWLRRLCRTQKRKRQLSQEIDKELAFHVGELTEGDIAAGMSPTEARRQARIAFGGQEQMAEGASDLEPFHGSTIFVTTSAFAGGSCSKVQATQLVRFSP